MKKKILVIGSAGYIGSVLIKNLKQKLDLNEYQILGVDTNWYSKNLEINKYNSYLPEIMYNYDCRNFNLKNLNINPKVIVFLAAVSNDPMGNRFKKATSEINTNSCIRLAKQAKAIGVKKFIFASSCSIYGSSGNTSRKENDPIDPLTDYAVSKVRSEEGLEKISDKNFQVISLRFATAAGYSPKLRLDLVFNDFVASATANKFIKILSNGSAWRPLIHVDDMSKAMLWGIKEKQNLNFLPINIGSDLWTFKIINLAKAISKIIKNTSISVSKKNFVDKRSYTVNFELFKKLAPKYQPTASFKNATLLLQMKLKENNLDLFNFRKSKELIRLNTLNDLIEKKYLNKQLFWKKLIK